MPSTTQPFSCTKYVVLSLTSSYTFAFLINETKEHVSYCNHVRLNEFLNCNVKPLPLQLISDCIKMRATPFFVLVALAVCFSYSLSLVISNDAAHPDLITRPIPGLNTPLRSKHYSGFLDAGKGKKFHYWFVESERDPINDPVVLWLNGGPGCSSLLGFLTEQGPFWVNKNDKSKLSENEFRWNKIANMIFLESPAGVGFSHRTDDGSLGTNDDAVADDNHAAITHFFKKFPQFKKNRFYVTGESYGGIYVPTLSVRILTRSPDINFKGFAVGNGILDWKMNTNSLVLFGYFHGMIGKKLWDPLIQRCCSRSKKDGQLIHPLLPGGCFLVAVTLTTGRTCCAKWLWKMPMEPSFPRRSIGTICIRTARDLEMTFSPSG